MTTQQQPVQQIHEPRNGFGITALVLAIIGLVFGFIPITGFIALILGALAVLFGLLGWGRVRRGAATNKKMTMIGALLGAGAIALGVWGMVTVFTVVDELGRDLEQIGEDFEREMDDLDQQVQDQMDCMDAIDIEDPDYTEKIEQC
jgi:hypothetical protein